MSTVKKRIAVLLLTILVCLSAVFPSMLLSAYAAETNYSNVLDDLQSDSSFDVSDYPDVPNDYSLQVIQIAESINRVLFIYVYQPSHATKDLTATTVRISTGINDNASWKDYKLSLISSQGVFDKYVVQDFTVKADALRYYDIPAIHRKWDSTLDAPAEHGNTISEVAYEVGKLYTASTVNGKVSYTCLATEVVVITDKYVGMIEYGNGFQFFQSWCDSHFIAFSTDWDIDALFEVDVGYVTQRYSWSFAIFVGERISPVGDPEEHFKTLTYTDVVTHQGDGWWAHEYSWNRIESVSDFIKNEDLTDECIQELQGKQWVLRFDETERSSWFGNGSNGEYYTEVSDVTIFRLKFETRGRVYNLGVVDNKQAGDGRPDNNNTDEMDFPSFGFGLTGWSWWKIILSVVGVLLLLWLLWKLLTWLISLPIRAVSAAGKSLKNATKKKKR